MRLRLVTLALIVALMSLFVVAPLSAGAQPATAGGTATVNLPGQIVGTFTNLQATLDQAGNIVISGLFTGQALVGGVLKTFTNEPFTTTLLSATGTCEVLTLHVGAIHLNLLGLVVDVAPIDIHITAQAGPGNLLGNLLCAVAHLLDSNAANQALANLLNRIFGLL